MMMKKGQILFTLVFLALVNTITVFAQNKPFPQQLNYPGCIKPSVAQATLNSDVVTYYNYWKGKYLKKSTANANHYYIAAGSTGGSSSAVTQSEAHGYGMVITALMAGADANAKTYYDGLYGMYDTHRSANNNNLMQWQVFADEHNANLGSATDGDMDIAYSLLLAHYQWGSNGTINYLAAAQKMITNGLKASYVYSTLRLGLADDATSDHLSTRPSDWMFDHMRAFKAHTNDMIWDQLAANLYNVYERIYTNYSPNTGLISDFVMYDPAQPAPPGKPQADEGSTTGDYSYNACRVPLRLVMDFAHYGTTSPKPYLNKMVSWARSKTGENPAKFGAGYKLNGTALSGSDYESGCFISPMVAASVIDPNNQKWLNDGWVYMKGSKDGYYEDTYNAMCMLFVSGNWWIPGGSAPVNQAPTVSITSPANNTSFTAPASITINANAADADGTVSKVDFYNGTILLGTDNSSPYSYSWTSVAAGNYNLTAKATDNVTATTTSSVVTVTVTTVTNPNQAPTVSITSPGNGSAFTAPASITINANAADADGTVSKVDFYNGATLLGTDNSSPFSYSWTGVAAGTYNLTAKATDNLNATTTTAAVTVTVNPVAVTQTPYGGSPQTIPGIIEAEKYDLGGQGVAFNETTTANQGGAFRTTEAVDVEPYGTGYNVGYIVTNEWLEYTVNVTAGTYKIDANVAATAAGKNFRLELDGVTIATFIVPNTGGWATFQLSTANNIALTEGQKVLRLFATSTDFNVDKITFTAVNSNPNVAPTVNITSPASGASFNAPASIAINANAADADGTVSKVDFYNGAALLGTDNSAPYSYSWTGIAAGSYTITAKATDNSGAETISSAVNIIVTTITIPNQAPTINLTSPADNTSANAPATITIAANATDADGTVSKVEFYSGTTLLFTDNSSPYSYSWSNIAAGTYSISAKATDNSGATSSSSAVSVTVNTVVNNACSSIAQYAENNGYVAGSKVKNVNNQYQCNPYPYSGWCNGAAWAYAPGTGAYWSDAWTLVGSCGSARTADEATVNEKTVFNSPNPFASQTTIEVVAVEAGEASVKVYDQTGQWVQTLSEGYLIAGAHQFTFDATSLKAGLYIVKYSTSSGVTSRKIMKTE
ncbi:MAG: T9SS type A sorting domain-containing protein [Cytophagaceae bacterium]|nr:T9SS type A sorting domain-containing protein [Cytophagaceae bacterium]